MRFLFVFLKFYWDMFDQTWDQLNDEVKSQLDKLSIREHDLISIDNDEMRC